MPPPPEMAAAEAATRSITHHSPPIPSGCHAHSHSCKWWPYSNSNDFGTNTAMIIIVLLCALVCALGLNTAIRCFLRGGRHGSGRLPQTQREVDGQRKPNLDEGASALVVAPTAVYSVGMKLGGAEAECAICLSEFVEGESIRVMGRCKHGFHDHCIEKWLSCHFSCPTCRQSCLASPPPSPETANCCTQPPPAAAEIPTEHLRNTP